MPGVCLLINAVAVVNGKAGVTHKAGVGAAPLAFTEHSAIMTATVLKSARAAEVSVYVVRTFMQFRDLHNIHLFLRRRLIRHDPLHKFLKQRHRKRCISVLRTINHSLLD